MHQTTPILTTLLLALLLAMPHDAALDCNGNIITIDAGAAVLYLDDRSSEPGDFNHWIYLEDNGVDGLQSGGENNVMDGCGSSILHPCLEDHCFHDNPDLLIF